MKQVQCNIVHFLTKGAILPSSGVLRGTKCVTSRLRRDVTVTPKIEHARSEQVAPPIDLFETCEK